MKLTSTNTEYVPRHAILMHFKDSSVRLHTGRYVNYYNARNKAAEKLKCTDVAYVKVITILNEYEAD